MKVYFYPVIVQVENPGYSAYVPDIDGCFSEGETLTETLLNIQDAIGLSLEDCNDYPTPSSPELIAKQAEPAKGQYVAVVNFNMLEYKKRNDNRAVKKTLTIPAWLNDEAEAQHINFSSVLQSALKERLDMN